MPTDEEPISTTLAMTDHPSPSTQAEFESKPNKILTTEEGNNIIITHACK